MSAAAPGNPALTLQELLALNDEIAALVRAGIPLERGLVQVAREMCGRVGMASEQLASRMAAGESLEQILASDTSTFPPVWRAVVTAGLRSGRLAAALEEVSAAGKRVSEMRQAVGLSLVYPLIVVLLAYGVFVYELIYLAPAVLNALEDLTATTDPLLRWAVWLGERARWWGFFPPLLAGVAGAWWWSRAGRLTRTGRAGWASRMFPFCSSLSRSVRDEQVATFAELLNLLLQHHAPLDEALTLAADASGSRSLAHAAERVSQHLRSGSPLTRHEARELQFPALLGWLIASGASAAVLQRNLMHVAERYRYRATRAANFAVVSIPIVVTAVVGGTATLLQGILIFGQVWKLWNAVGA